MNLKIRRFFLAKNKLLKKLTVVLLMLTCLQVSANDLIEVKGTVSDENGKPMQGASVKFINTDKGTSTNADGDFILEIPVQVASWLFRL
jgi:hypothetical protein